MASLSWLLILALSFVLRPVCGIPQEQLVSITQAPQSLQSGPAPDLAGTASASSPSCGGCYLVADVAGLVWYSEVFLNTAGTALVSVGVGNGTRATRTSFLQNEGEFTFDQTATTAGGALTQVNYEPTVNVGGAILTSPTAYNVFTAFSITSEVVSNGVCVTSPGPPTTLSSAYTQTLQSTNGRVILDPNGQRAFINFLGFTKCSNGGENVAATALIQVTNTTATMTSTFSNVPLAAVSATLTIAPQSIPIITTAGSTTKTPSITNFPSAAAPIIVVGNKTITPTPNPIGLPIFSGNLTGTTTIAGITSGGYIYPTGTGGNFSAPIPFFGKASVNRADVWLTTAWGAGMLGLGVFVYYL